VPEEREEAGTLLRESEIENSQGNIFSLQDSLSPFFSIKLYINVFLKPYPQFGSGT
jgi:hypothetical protein